MRLPEAMSHDCFCIELEAVLTQLPLASTFHSHMLTYEHTKLTIQLLCSLYSGLC